MQKINNNVSSLNLFKLKAISISVIIGLYSNYSIAANFIYGLKPNFCEDQNSQVCKFDGITYDGKKILDVDDYISNDYIRYSTHWFNAQTMKGALIMGSYKYNKEVQGSIFYLDGTKHKPSKTVHAAIGHTKNPYLKYRDNSLSTITLESDHNINFNWINLTNIYEDFKFGGGGHKRKDCSIMG